MSFKPGDFFLGVINFLGVLVPGGFLVFLLMSHFLPPYGQGSLPLWLEGPTSHWVIFGGASYVAGQLMLAFTELLNRYAAPIARRVFKPLHRNMRHLREGIDLLPPSEKPWDAAARFHAAFSYVHLEDAVAAGEIDRHMADYKLLRNLVGVFLVDAVATAISLALRLDHPLVCWWRLVAGILLGLLSFVSFVRMYCWAQILAFEYSYLLICRKRVSS